MPDVGVPDDEVSDVEVSDVGVLDDEVPDAEVPDVEPPDVEPPDDGEGPEDAPPVVVVGVVLVVGAVVVVVVVGGVVVGAVVGVVVVGAVVVDCVVVGVVPTAGGGGSAAALVVSAPKVGSSVVIWAVEPGGTDRLGTGAGASTGELGPASDGWSPAGGGGSVVEATVVVVVLVAVVLVADVAVPVEDDSDTLGPSATTFGGVAPGSSGEKAARSTNPPVASAPAPRVIATTGATRRRIAGGRRLRTLRANTRTGGAAGIEVAGVMATSGPVSACRP